VNAASCVAALVVAAWLPLAAASADEAPDLMGLRVHRGDAPARPLAAVLADAPAMVSFSASYCPPCRAEVPVLRRAAERWRDRGVRVVGIAVDAENAADVAAVARDWGIDYDLYWLDDDGRRAAGRLAPEGMPVTFFVRRAGVSRLDRILTDEDIRGLVPERLGLAPGPPG
jgi:thiol-disulfide isomerase/thioredoxin